jgi:protein-tyrosine phosphatase
MAPTPPEPTPSGDGADHAGPALRVCFVCLGNICRSPTAEALAKAHLAAHGVTHAVEVDSAGTGAWHVGERPDPRAVAEGARRGVEVGGRARQFRPDDFARFDLVVALDHSNRRDLERLAPDEVQRGKVRLLRSFDPDAPPDAEVPDPYAGGPDRFRHAFDLIDSACAGLARHAAERLRAGGAQADPETGRT